MKQIVSKMYPNAYVQLQLSCYVLGANIFDDAFVVFTLRAS